jgi:hypothetical protein
MIVTLRSMSFTSTAKCELPVSCRENLGRIQQSMCRFHSTQMKLTAYDNSGKIIKQTLKVQSRQVYLIRIPSMRALVSGKFLVG